MSHSNQMMKVTREMALRYHEFPRPGKIEIQPTKPYTSQLDLSLAYSPGVAFPCVEIEKNPLDVYKYTDKGNLVGVVSNGTAVLGLGDIGPLAGKPVMEGKALLFKIFAGLDAFDIEVDEKDPKRLIQVVKAIAPTFGGINLEDIKAPECFEVEKTLKEECDIPVMHDDQHGTAIISGAGLINALEIQKKDIANVRLVVNGAGAAAVSCTRLYERLGVRRENIVMCDSKGVIRSDRENLSPSKKEFATDRDLHTLAEALVDADVFLGLSVANVVTPEMVRSMAPRPIVFALANPNPEIDYNLAVEARPDVIVATGRSDYPNQINNVIGFPYIFRGALDSGATAINEEMKIAAVYAIADLAKLPVPSVVDEAYGKYNLTFGPDYILPKALDPRLLVTVAPAVAKAAEESGIALRPITDWDAYKERLHRIMGDDGSMMRRIMDLVREQKKSVVFAEANSDNMLRAAQSLHNDGVCNPILLGNAEMIEARAKRLNLDIKGIKIINPSHDDQAETRERYAKMLLAKKEREGITMDGARDLMFDRTYFGIMMVEAGEADAFMGGIYSSGSREKELAASIVGLQEGYRHSASMHIVTSRRGTLFLADTTDNPVCDKDAIVDIARLAALSISFFGHKPVEAVLSYSNFGSNSNDAEPYIASQAVKELHEKYPEIEVDGEMQLDYALNTKLRDRMYPFSTLNGKEVNTLIFPNLAAANTAYKVILAMGVGSVVGPVQMGLRKPIYFSSMSAEVRDIVNLSAIAALDAIANASR